MSDSVSWGVQKTFSTETHRLKEEEASEEEADQMTISQYFQYHKPISPELKLGKPMTKKKRTKGPKFGAKKVFSGHDLSKSETRKRKWVIYDSSEDSEVETNIVMVRAKEIQENLDPNFPSFIKSMLRSNVTKGFWMGLPSSFCKLHLPKCDKTIVLEGESGKEYETNFLADKCGLSGGWKAFSAAHKLVEGDVVVFQLVQPFKFKMYMVRANDMAEVDGALGLLNLDVSTRESDFEGCKDTDSIKCKKAGEKRLRPLSPEICGKKLEMNTMVINYSPEPLADQIHSCTEDLGSEEVNRKDYSLSSSFVDLKNFKLFLHGSSMDSEMPKHLRIKYYELCCKQKSYLHEHLVRSVSSALATGIIVETINIADAIRACNLSTSREEFALWDKTLEAFELLGMKVGFLCGRLNRLVSFAFNPVRVEESKRIMEARLERDHVQGKVIALEQKLMELKQISDGLDEEIEGLKVNEEIDEFFFHEEANASW